MGGVDVTTWLPTLLALVLVAVEARRQLVYHFRREWFRALMARATVLKVGTPAVFSYFIGMDVGFFQTPFEPSKHYIIKIDCRRGLLWVVDGR